MRFVRIRVMATTLFALTALVVGCGDDNPVDTQNDEALSLPSDLSMSLDMSRFEVNPLPDRTGSDPRLIVIVDPGGDPNMVGKSRDENGAMLDPAGYSNYVAGRTTIGLANVAIAAVAAAPAYAFSAASATTPVRQEDGSWTWTYSASRGGVGYACALNGRREGNGTSWTMRVSTTGLVNNVTDFLWFSGQTQNGVAQGYWQIYDIGSPSAPANLVRVDFNVIASDNFTSSWLNNRVGGSNYGDMLDYAMSGTEASITYTRASGGSAANVRWNTGSTAGSVQLPLYNQGQESCWDESHLNSDCNR